jgi:hypothetical protein
MNTTTETKPTTEPINWDNPKERFRLAERVGSQEYNRLFEQHVKDSTICTANGYGIRPTGSRFGRLFQVLRTNAAFKTLEDAVNHARTLEPAKE